MQTIKILFFGTTSDSVLVLDHLFNSLPIVQQAQDPEPSRGTTHNSQLTTYNIQLSAIITQPPRPIGRKQLVTPTPTELWGKEHTITVLSFPNQKETSYLYEDEDAVINTLETFKADLLISASYGQKIPEKIIQDARFGGINVHPSLLPRWRGPDPLPWQILSGDHQTGVTVVTISTNMDEGKIMAQKKIPLLDTDEREPLRKKLFELGAELLVDSLPDILDGKNNGEAQDPDKVVTARRLHREDGFIPWEIVVAAMEGKTVERELLPVFLRQFIKEASFNPSELIDRAMHGLTPWPGVWSTVSIKNEDKRLKILRSHLQPTTDNVHLILDTVQLEGKNPVSFEEFKRLLY